jgi:hypothetical protein
VGGCEGTSGDIFIKRIASYAPPLETLDLIYADLRFVNPRLLPSSLRHIKVDWKVLDSRCIFRLLKLPLESVSFGSLNSLSQGLSAHGLSLPAENNWSRLTTLELKDYNSPDMEEFTKILLGVGRPGPRAPIRWLTMPKYGGPWLSQVVEAFSATLTFIDISDPLDENLVTALSHCQYLEELRVRAKDLEVLIPFFFDSHHEFLAFYPIAQDPETLALAEFRATPLVPSLRRVTYPKWSDYDIYWALRVDPAGGTVMDEKWGIRKQCKADFIESLIIEELRRRFPLNQFPHNHCTVNRVPIHPRTRFVKDSWDL